MPNARLDRARRSLPVGYQFPTPPKTVPRFEIPQEGTVERDEYNYRLAQGIAKLEHGLPRVGL